MSFAHSKCSSVGKAKPSLREKSADTKSLIFPSVEKAISQE